MGKAWRMYIVNMSEKVTSEQPQKAAHHLGEAKAPEGHCNPSCICLKTLSVPDMHSLTSVLHPSLMANPSLHQDPSFPSTHTLPLVLLCLMTNWRLTHSLIG